MTRRRRGSGNPFFDAAMLAMEAQQVVALRLAKLALGGQAAETEARRMVEEKVAAAGVATTLMTAAAARGRLDHGAEDVVAMLRKEVRANRKRLTD